MTFPLFAQDAFGYPVSAALAGAVGFLFGFVLERAGFGRATVLTAQFYGRNMRVLKVMFSAVVTAALGLALVEGVGVLDMSLVTVAKAYLWPLIVGGLVMGAGFVTSGYCPGTSVVSAASGNRDGIVAFAGIIIGSLLFGVAYPLLEGFYLSSPLGEIRFPELFGLPHPLLAAAVLAMAIGAFLGAEKVEGLFARRDKTAPPTSVPRARNAVFAALGAIAAAGLLTMPFAEQADAKAASSAKHVQELRPVELARLLVVDPSGLILLDLRERAECEKQTIAGAACKPEAELTEAFVQTELPPQRRLVVFSGGAIDRLPRPLEQFASQVFVLRGGFEAFRSQLLEPPVPPDRPTEQSLADYRLRSSLHAHFTGARVQTQKVELKPRKVKRKIKTGGGC